MTTSYSNEIGGYFELESANLNKLVFSDGIMLNSARNALRYIVRAYSIREMLVPYYTCPVVWDALQKEGVKLIFYHINKNLEVDLNLSSISLQNKYILVNNYFGVKTDYIRKLAQFCPRLIVDNAQALYAPKLGLAAIYSPRKFFGLPDGGIALCSKSISNNFEQGLSYQRCNHLFIRADVGAECGYSYFKQNDASLDNLNIEFMSNLTTNMFMSCDTEKARLARLKNFTYLHKALSGKNELSVRLSPEDVPMVYPLVCTQQELRQKLINNKIFVATYWPRIETFLGKDELFVQRQLLALPIDQRYNETHMQRIVEIIND